jgi:hypothetical protein
MHVLEGWAFPIIDLLKKKQLRLHGGPDGLAKYQTKKKKNKPNVDVGHSPVSVEAERSGIACTSQSRGAGRVH